MADRLSQWIEVDYNQRYRHSSLGLKTPEQFEKDRLNSHTAQFATVD